MRSRMRSRSPRPSGTRTPRPSEHEHIKSVVRVRPLLPYEISEHEECCVEIPPEGKSVILTGKNNYPREFSFLSVLGPECSQAHVYEQSGVKDLLKAAMQGYAVTVMAYGQVQLHTTQKHFIFHYDFNCCRLAAEKHTR